MNRVKYLIVVFVGTFVYISLSLGFGQNSIKCYKQMEEQKRIVSKQKAEIQNINSELNLELSALKNDKAVIAAYARKMDYVADGEKLVKINGLKPYQTALYDTGTVVRHQEPDYVSEDLCKMGGLVAALFCLILFLIADFRNGNITIGKNKKPVVTGVPIYDLPQI